MSIPSVVCNGGCSLHLQSSCVDSPLLEPTSKIPPSLLWLHQEREDIEERNSKVKTSNNVGGWSFLQALANPSHTQKLLAEPQKVYVHPLANRSASAMNTKSLNICTESLGSETGSDIICESCCMDECCGSSLLLEKQKYGGVSKSGFKKMKEKGSFPPPLTSISRLEGVQVMPFREEGRLVIKAVNITTTPASYFHTQRSNGRLTLSLRKPEHLESQEEEEDDEEEAEKVTQI